MWTYRITDLTLHVRIYFYVTILYNYHGITQNQIATDIRNNRIILFLSNPNFHVKLPVIPLSCADMSTFVNPGAGAICFTTLGKPQKNLFLVARPIRPYPPPPSSLVAIATLLFCF